MWLLYNIRNKVICNEMIAAVLEFFFMDVGRLIKPSEFLLLSRKLHGTNVDWSCQHCNTSNPYWKMFILCIPLHIEMNCNFLSIFNSWGHIPGSSVEQIIQIQFGPKKTNFDHVPLYITIVSLIYAGNPGDSQLERNANDVSLAKSIICLSETHNISLNDIMSCQILKYTVSVKCQTWSMIPENAQNLNMWQGTATHSCLANRTHVI